VDIAVAADITVDANARLNHDLLVSPDQSFLLKVSARNAVIALARGDCFRHCAVPRSLGPVVADIRT